MANENRIFRAVNGAKKIVVLCDLVRVDLLVKHYMLDDATTKKKHARESLSS